MGEQLGRQPEVVYTDDYLRAVEALELYLRACRSRGSREPNDPSRPEGDNYYLEARQLSRQCDVGTSQLFIDVAEKLEGEIEVPHRLSELKDELPEAIRERCIFY